MEIQKNSASVVLAQAETDTQISHAHTLFLEYARSLGFSLCFQGFDQELAGLPGSYALPDGRLLLAEYQDKLAGCIALRRAGSDICEMKRLYVRPEFRGQGLGKVLAEAVIAESRTAGYRRMRLDTIESQMQNAVALYRMLGFKEIAPYRVNPIAGALYMELEL